MCNISVCNIIFACLQLASISKTRHLKNLNIRNNYHFHMEYINSLPNEWCIKCVYFLLFPQEQFMPIVIILVISVFFNFELHSFVFNIYFIIKCEMLSSFLLVMNKRLE